MTHRLWVIIYESCNYLDIDTIVAGRAKSKFSSKFSSSPNVLGKSSRVWKEGYANCRRKVGFRFLSEKNKFLWKSLKPTKVGTILNEIFFLRFIKINFKKFENRLFENSRTNRKFDVLNFWNLVWNFPKKVQDGFEGARWNRNEKIQRWTRI